MDTKTKNHLLQLRLDKKKTKPSFKRHESWRLVRLKGSWRKMHGVDNRTRRKLKDGQIWPDPGYQSPKAVRFLHPSGLQDIIVASENDFKNLSPKVHGIRLLGNLGSKKKLQLIEIARSKGFRILNIGISRRELKELETKETGEKEKMKLTSKKEQIQKIKEKAAKKTEESTASGPVDNVSSDTQGEK